MVQLKLFFFFTVMLWWSLWCSFTLKVEVVYFSLSCYDDLYVVALRWKLKFIFHCLCYDDLYGTVMLRGKLMLVAVLILPCKGLKILFLDRTEYGAFSSIWDADHYMLACWFNIDRVVVSGHTIEFMQNKNPPSNDGTFLHALMSFDFQHKSVWEGDGQLKIK